MKRIVFSIIALLTASLVAKGQTKESFTVNEVSFKMVKVEGGKFVMGATPEQGDVVSADPAHEETVNTWAPTPLYSNTLPIFLLKM